MNYEFPFMDALYYCFIIVQLILPIRIPKTKETIQVIVIFTRCLILKWVSFQLRFIYDQ